MDRVENGKHAPREIRISYLLWLLAVGAGAFETVLVVIQTLSRESRLSNEIILGVSIRLIIFSIATYIIVQMNNGRNWARLSLTVLLGVLGSASLLISPISWFTEGHTLEEYFAGADAYSLWFAASRTVHLAAVIGGLMFMFRPAANRFFRPAAAS